jgi:surface protein
MPTTTGKIYLGSTLVSGGEPSPGYIRPSDWLPLPEAAAQGVNGLLAVFPNNQDRNLLAIQAQTAYTVDWGDGVIEDFASNVQGQHEYDYDLLPAETLSSRGYKQVIVKVTPQAGQNLTRCFLANRHTDWGTNTAFGYPVNWLDLNINLPNLSSGGQFLGISQGTQGTPNLLERCHIASWGALSNAAGLFQRCRAIQSLNENEWITDGIISMSNMFSNCDQLQSLDCSSWNTSSVTSANGFAQNCVNLKTFKGINWNLLSCSNLSSFFTGCNSLSTCEVENWQLRTAGAGVAADNLFNGCSSLQSLNLSNWNGKFTTLLSTFNGCRKWTDFTSIQNWDTSSVTNLSNTFAGTGADTVDISAWNISAVTNLTDIFNAGSRLRTVKFSTWPTAIVTTVGSSFCTANYNLQTFTLGGGEIAYAGTSVLNFSNCALSATQLNAIYSALADYTSQTGKTINVNNNWGIATDDPSIATAKNWTVIG